MANTKIPVELSSTPGIVDNSNATAITIDSSENVGIGNTQATAINNASGLGNLVVGSGSGAEGITIYSGSDSYGGLNFADATSGGGSYAGYIKFNHVDNSFGHFIGNTERMRIDASGNVGIGRTSIAQPSSGATTLAIQGTSTTKGGAIRLYSSDDSVAAYIYPDNTSGLSINTSTSHPMVFRTAGSERLRIDSAGNVGIGTSSPAQSLDTTGKIRIRDGGNTTIPSIQMGASGVDGLSLPSTNTVAFITNSAERMRIDSSGNVGIGAVPSGEAAAAHVVRLGDQVCIAEYDDGSNPEQFNLFHNSDSSETYIETGTASVIQQRAGEIIFKNAASGSAGAAISFSERMRIDSSGNLLVGTTQTPATLLSDGHEGVGIGNDGYIVSTRFNDIAAYFKRENSNGNVVSFLRDATSVGTISVTTSATAYNTSSDYRLKDVTGQARGLDVINALNPVSYNWKADGKADEGLIAQEVLDIVPNAVSGSEEEMYQMDYSKLVVHLVAGMKEQQAQIEALQSEINELKNS